MSDMRNRTKGSRRYNRFIELHPELDPEASHPPESQAAAISHVLIQSTYSSSVPRTHKDSTASNSPKLQRRDHGKGSATADATPARCKLPKEFQDEHHLAVFKPYFDAARGCAGVVGIVQDFKIAKIKVNGQRNERTVYLRSVPPSLTIGVLRSELDKMGTVLRLRLVPPGNWYSFDKQWMYGFVEYQDRRSAEALEKRETLCLRDHIDELEVDGHDRSHSATIRAHIAKTHIGNHFNDDAFYDPSGICQTGLGLSGLRTVEEFALSSVRAPLQLPDGQTKPHTKFAVEGEAPPPVVPKSQLQVVKPTLPAYSYSSVELPVRVGSQNLPPPSATPLTTTSAPRPGVFEVQLDCQVANSGRLNIGVVAAPQTNNNELAPEKQQDVMAALRQIQAATAAELKVAEAHANDVRAAAAAAAATAALDDDSSDESTTSSHTTSHTCNTSSTGSGSSGSTVIGKDGQPLSRKAARGKLRKDRQLGKKIAALATAIVSSSDSGSTNDTSSTNSEECTPSLPGTPQHQAVPARLSAPSSCLVPELTEAEIETELSRKKQMARKLEAQLKALEIAKSIRSGATAAASAAPDTGCVTTMLHTHLTRRQKASLKRDQRLAEEAASETTTSVASTPASGPSSMAAPSTPMTISPTITVGGGNTKKKPARVAKGKETVDICVMGRQVGRIAINTIPSPKLPAYEAAAAASVAQGNPIFADVAPTVNVAPRVGLPPSFPASAISAMPFVPGATPPPYLQAKFPVTASPFTPSLQPPVASSSSTTSTKATRAQWQSTDFLNWLAQKSQDDQAKFYSSLSLVHKRTPNEALSSTATTFVKVGVPPRDTSNDVQPTQRRMIAPVRALLERQRLKDEASCMESCEIQKSSVSVFVGQNNVPPKKASSKPPVHVEEDVPEEDEYDVMLSTILSVFDTPPVVTDDTASPISVEAAIANINEFFQEQQQQLQAGQHHHHEQELGLIDIKDAVPTNAGDIGVIGGLPSSSCSSSCGSHPLSAPVYGGDGETDDVQSGSSVAQDTSTFTGGNTTPHVTSAATSHTAPMYQHGWSSSCNHDGGADDEVDIEIKFNEFISECMRPDPVDCEGETTPLARLHSMASTVSEIPSKTASVTNIHTILDSALSSSSSSHSAGDDSGAADPSTIALVLRAPLQRLISTLIAAGNTAFVSEVLDASASLLRSIKDVGSTLSLSLLEDDSDTSGDEASMDSTLSVSPCVDSKKPLVCLEMIALEELRAVVCAVVVCVAAPTGSLPAAGEEMISSGMEWLAEASSPKYLTTPSSLIVNGTTELLDELGLLNEDEESETFRLAGTVAGYVHVRHQQNLLQCAAIAVQGLTKGAQMGHAAAQQLVGPLKSQQILLGNQHKRIKAVFSMTGARCGRKDFDVCVRATSPSPNQLTTLERFFGGLVDASNTSLLFRLFGIAIPPTHAPAVASLTQVLSEIEAAVGVTKDTIKRINAHSDKPAPTRDNPSLLPSITH